MNALLFSIVLRARKSFCLDDQREFILYKLESALSPEKAILNYHGNKIANFFLVDDWSLVSPTRVFAKFRNTPLDFCDYFFKDEESKVC